METVCGIFEPQRRLRQVEAAERWNEIVQTFSFSISSTDNKKKTCRLYEFIHTLLHSLPVSLKSFSLSGTYRLKIDAERLRRPLRFRSFPASQNGTAANFDHLASHWCQRRPGPTLIQQIRASFTGHLCKFPLPPLLVVSAINNALSQRVYFMKIKREKKWEGLPHNKFDSLAAKQSVGCFVFCFLDLLFSAAKLWLSCITFCLWDFCI